MVCPNCGVDNPDGAFLCAACGTRLPEPSGTPAEPSEAPLEPAPAPPEPTPVKPPPPPVFSAPPEPERPRAKWSGWATASLVLGLLGFVTCGITGLFGIITGAIALSHIRRSNGALAGSSAAWAGMLASALSFLVILPAAVLYPVFSRARDVAIESKCLNDMRQVGLAVQMYAADNDGALPPADRWEDAVTPLMPKREMLGCPRIHDGSGYAMNGAAAPQRQVRFGWEHPEMVLLFDGGHGGRNVVGGREIAAVRHPRGLTVGLLAGNARTIPPDQIDNLDWTARPLIQPARK